MKLRKTDFQGGKSVLIVDMMKYPEMESIAESKDISASSAERLLQTLHFPQSRRMLSNGYNMPNILLEA